MGQKSKRTNGKGLTGAQAVWANQKYHGHQTLLPGITDWIESH